MRLIKQDIVLEASAEAPEDAVSKVIFIPSGKLVAAALKVPTLGDPGHTAKVALSNPNDASLIYLPDNVIGSGTCAHANTTPARFAVTNGSYYPLPADASGVAVTITASANQEANRTFTLYLVVC